MLTIDLQGCQCHKKNVSNVLVKGQTQYVYMFFVRACKQLSFAFCFLLFLDIGIKFQFKEMPIGGSALDAVGVPLPDETLDTAKSSDAVLLGAIGGFGFVYQV